MPEETSQGVVLVLKRRSRCGNCFCRQKQSEGIKSSGKATKVLLMGSRSMAGTFPRERARARARERERERETDRQREKEREFIREGTPWRGFQSQGLNSSGSELCDRKDVKGQGEIWQCSRNIQCTTLIHGHFSLEFVYTRMFK
jgi:hypothetical protein